MHTSGRILLLTGLALLALLLVRPAIAEPPPPLEWLREDKETVKVTPAQPARVQVLNRSSSPLDVQVKLIPVETGTAVSLLEVAPPTARLGPGEAVTFTISAPKAKPEPGTYVLVAYSAAPEGSIRRNVQLEVPPKEPPVVQTPLTFLNKEMKLRTYRGLSWGDPMEDAILPVRGDQAPPEAYLVAEDGETAHLSLSGRKKLVEDAFGFKVSVDSVDQVGTYTGKLTVGEKDNENVSVTLTSAHHPLFAVFAVCGGILLALAIQRYMGVLRLTWPLAEREATVGARFEEAQAAFDHTAAGRPFASYSLSDFEIRQGALRSRIPALQRSVFTSLETTNSTYQAIDTELKSLEAVPEQWKGFAARLAALETALANIDWDQVPPNAYLQPPKEHPVLYDRMQLLLTGSALTIQQLGERFTETSKGPDRLAVWESLNRRAAALHASFRKLQTTVDTAPDSPQIQEVRLLLPPIAAALVPVWNGLWTHTDIDPTAQTSLDSVESQIAIARSRAPEPDKNKSFAPQDVLPASDALAETFRRLAETAEPTAEEATTDDATRVRLLQERQRRAAAGVAFVAFLIALYTGLEKFYVDKPFGHWSDYVDIVVWAVATQSLLDMLLRGLDRVWGLGGLFRGRTTPLL